MKTKLIIAMTIAALATLAVACGGDDDNGGADATDTPAASSSDGAQTSRATATPAMTEAPDKPPAVDGEPVTTASGLQYITIKEGSGDSPTELDTVLVHYTGWLAPDGPKFDSSVDRGQPTSFPVNGVIGGFAEGLTHVKPGGTIRLIIPPELGYGAAGSGPIPPNATLIFDVTLIGIH